MKLLNILTMFGLLFTSNLKPQTIQSVSSSATELNLLYYGDASAVTYTLAYYDYYDENPTGYAWYGVTSNTQLNNYCYMFYPFNIGNNGLEYHSVFIDFIYYGDNFNISGNLFEFDILSFNTNPFTSFSNTFNTFYYNIDLMPFNYYISSASVPNIQLNDKVLCSFTTSDIINTNDYTFLCLRFSKDYFTDFIDSDYLTDFEGAGESYFYGNGFSSFTSWYNPSFYLSPIYFNENNYNLGFQDGVNSVNTDSFYQDGYTNGYTAGYDNAVSSFDTSIYYDEGYQAGINSVDTNAIYQNAYQAGYNVGVSTGSNSYGITELLYSIFNIPIIVLSNLLSFTIFGRDMWGLIVSIAMLGVLLYLIRLIIKASRPD